MKVLKDNGNGKPQTADPVQQLNEFKEQINAWQQRVDFLKEWVTHLMGRIDALGTDPTTRTDEYFELSNKLFDVRIEIEAKMGAIDKRQRDMQQSQLMFAKQMEQLQAEWSQVVKDLKSLTNAQTMNMPVEQRHLVAGMLKRAKGNKYRNGQQQYQDMQLAKNILAAVNRMT